MERPRALPGSSQAVPETPQAPARGNAPLPFLEAFRRPGSWMPERNGSTHVRCVAVPLSGASPRKAPEKELLHDISDSRF